MNKIVISDGSFSNISRRKFSMRSDFRFNVVLFIFVFWTLLQAIIPMQILPIGLVKEIEYLKSVFPAFGMLICGFIYLDKLKGNNVFLPFGLFCLFVFCNVSFRLILGGDNIKYLAHPIMFIVWAFCMFMLAPSIFDSLFKVRRFLRFSIFVLVPVILFSSLWAYSHEYEIARIYSGHGLRYLFAYLHPGYLGGVCYSIICGSLMLRELSDVSWEKNLLLLFILVFWVLIVLASSRTYILASTILFLFYFWHKGRFFKKLSWIILVGCMLFFLNLLWNSSIVENCFDYLNSRSSGRLMIWLNQLNYMMLDGIDWKVLIGKGIYATGDQVIQLAEGRVTQSFARFAIDNLYIEMFIMHGAIGCSLFFWGLYRLFSRWKVFGKLKLIPGGVRYKNLLSIAFGSLMGVLIGSLFASIFPSVGNTINSIVFPTSVAMIFIIARKVQLKSKQITG